MIATAILDRVLHHAIIQYPGQLLPAQGETQSGTDPHRGAGGDRLIKGSRVKLSVCGDYRMDIIVSIIFLAFIALLVYASIDATKHPK